MFVRLVDAKLHEDAIHRGPAQTIPAVRNGIKGAMMRAKTVLLEPMQKAFVSVPNDWLGQVTREVTNRRGIIEDMPSEGEVTTVVGVLPIAETFGFSNDIRAASQGRAVWNTENLGFEQLPPQLFDKVVAQIRTRKGLKPEPCRILLRRVREMPGSIVGLFAAPKGGVPKPMVQLLQVTTEGCVGDYQRDKKHHGGPLKAVCLFSDEVISHLQDEGHPIFPGSVGENVLVKDVDWSSVGIGTQFCFNEVILEVTSRRSAVQNYSNLLPTGNLNPFQ